METVKSIRVATTPRSAPTTDGTPVRREVSTGVPNALRVLGGVAATGIGAGIGAVLCNRSGGLGWKFGAVFGAFVGGMVGGIGNVATWDLGRARVGTVDGSYHWKEKVGEEDYRTTCTRTTTDSNGTHTTRYPCTKTRNIYEDRWSDTTEDLKVMGTVARGSLDEVVDRLDAKDDGVFVVIRSDNAYEAHRIGDGIIDFPKSWELLDPGAVAVVDVRDGGFQLADLGPEVTSDERATLER